MTKKLVLAALLMGALALGFAQPGYGPRNWNNPAIPSTVLSVQAKEALLEALTGPVGEYAAYATYDAVIQQYGNLEPYLSIRRSETQHIAALQRQLERYGVTYPATNPYLGKISLPAELKAVAKAEAETEISNAAMYDKLLGAVADYPDLTRVFENLKRASLVGHLTLFKAAAEQGGSLTTEQMQAAHQQIEPQMKQQMNGRGMGLGIGNPSFQNRPMQGRLGGGPNNGWRQGPRWR